jgi:hypothetical protein
MGNALPSIGVYVTFQCNGVMITNSVLFAAEGCYNLVTKAAEENEKPLVETS